MKTSIVILFCIVCIATNFVLAQNQTQTSACDRNKWNLFKLKFGKKYSNASEDSHRFARFCENLLKIEKHNDNPAATYKMEVNQFSDMTLEEWESISNGMLKMESVDWSLHPQRVSPARNQGLCGSCWAFSLVGLLEGQQKPHGRDNLIRLSEQNLIDCNILGYGCSGGLLEDTLNDIKRMGGLMSLADYPYRSGWSPRRRRICNMDEAKIVESTRDIGDPKTLPIGNEDFLKRVVANYGPVAIGYHSTQKFLNYKSGIFYEEACSRIGNHAMLIVGYGTDASGQDYWKLKNSWGGSSWNPFNKWGQKGFGLVARNRNNNCGIASYPVIVTKSVTIQ